MGSEDGDFVYAQGLEVDYCMQQSAALLHQITAVVRSTKWSGNG